MAVDNNNTPLVLRAMDLSFHHDRYSIGKVYQDASARYNTYRGSNHPYEMNWHDNSSNILTVHNDSDGSPHPKYVSNFDEVDLYEGITFTDRHRFNEAYSLYYSRNLRSEDVGALGTVLGEGRGTFLIGPEGPYHNHIINETAQPAYWSHIDPSGLFTFSYMDFESTGVHDFTSNGQTQSVPRIYDIARDSFHYPNGLNVNTQDVRTHATAHFGNHALQHSIQNTRAISFSGGNTEIGSSTGAASGRMEFNYNLGDIQHTDNDNDFSIYMKFRPTGYIDEPAGIAEKSASISLFQNHTIKLALVPVRSPQDGVASRQGAFKLCMYGRIGGDTSNTIGMWDNANYVAGFDPTPNARNANKYDDWAASVAGPDANNMYYQWLGSDSVLFDNNHLLGTNWVFPYKFGINKQAFYSNNADGEQQYGLQILGRSEPNQPGEYGSVLEFNNGIPGGSNPIQWPTATDQELGIWYNWAVMFPEEIQVGKTHSIVVSYASSGCDERNNLLMSTFNDPYSSGLLMEQVPTISVMFNNNDDIYTQSFNRTKILNKYRAYFDDYTNEAQSYYSSNAQANYSSVASYDIHCVFNTLGYSEDGNGFRYTTVGSNMKPFQTFAEASDNTLASISPDNVYNGYEALDFYASGYLGSSQFSGYIEEFGYVKETISPSDRKKLIDNTNNLGGLIGYNTDDAFTADSDKITFRVASGTTYGENEIGGMFNSEYAVSSSLEVNITNVLAASAEAGDGVFIWNMDPFIEPNDLVVNVVLSHTDFGAEQVAPTLWCNIMDKSLWQQDITYDPGHFGTLGDSAFVNRVVSSELLNQKGSWFGDRITIDPNVTRQKFSFSGDIESGACGNWDLRDKYIVFGVDYPASGNAYDAQLDLYAMDLDIDWFKTEVELTGDDVTGGSNNIDLFIKGGIKIAQSGDIDLFLMNIKADDNTTLFAGVANGFPSGIMPLFTAASASGTNTLYNNTPLNIRGKGIENSGVDLMLRVDWPAEGLPLFIGKSTPDDQVTVEPMNLMIDGNYNSDTDKAANLFIYGIGQYGDVDPASVLPLFIQQGSASDDRIDPESAMNLFINSRIFNTTDNVSLSLVNNKTESNAGVNLVIRKAGTDGAYPGTGNLPLYIERVPASEGMMGLYLLGHESPISSGVNMFITATLPTENLDTNMFMANYSQTNNLEIYMRGF